MRRATRSLPTSTPARFLAAMASSYIEICETEHKRPVEKLVEKLAEWRGEQYKADTVKGWLREARERGLLTDPPRRGVAGGQLTEKGVRALPTRIKIVPGIPTKKPTKKGTT
jgi:repressor of nif and glnA expression